MSPPMRGRGLKHITPAPSGALLKVAPHAGAWIETGDEYSIQKALKSPPMRGRGLKLIQALQVSKDVFVAPHAGAWIETLSAPAGTLTQQGVAPHAGAWIETHRTLAPRIGNGVKSTIDPRKWGQVYY